MFGIVMAYGLYPFTIDTSSFEELTRETHYRHPSHDVVGGRPLSQYVGPGDETITINGSIYPTFKGSPLSLDALRALAEDGKSWPLVSGYGYVYGAFVITSIRETRAVHDGMGSPKKITFSLSLKRTEENLNDALGLITENVASLISSVS